MYCCVICEYIEKFCFALRKYMYKCFSPVRLLFRCTAKEWSYFTFAQQWPLAVCTEVTRVREKKKIHLHFNFDDSVNLYHAFCN